MLGSEHPWCATVKPTGTPTLNMAGTSLPSPKLKVLLFPAQIIPLTSETGMALHYGMVLFQDPRANFWATLIGWFCGSV